MLFIKIEKECTFTCEKNVIFRFIKLRWVTITCILVGIENAPYKCKYNDYKHECKSQQECKSHENVMNER